MCASNFGVQIIVMKDNFPGFSTRWVRLAVLNFVVAAMAGAALRYKVTFPFPQAEFKNLLHAHSHFAFSGWVSTCLFALVLALFTTKEQQERLVYRLMFILSQVFSYGMLFSFIAEEYGAVSITFSTLYIFVTYVFTWLIWRDTRAQAGSVAVTALRASLVWLVLSSLGPYGLAYLKASHSTNGGLYHNSIYWYLHFQYNGWFAFAVFALLIRYIERRFGMEAGGRLRLPLRLMLWACVPAYLLSVLWVAPPLWVFILAGAAGAVQLVALIIGLKSLRCIFAAKQNDLPRTLLLFSAIAFAIKILLQFLSVFPALNQFVFGHRPVIIGYLHLVLLAFVSFFLLALGIRFRMLDASRRIIRAGLIIFMSGVLLNEAGLMLQGFAGMLMTPMKWVPPTLFAAAVLMVTGLIIFARGQLPLPKRSAGEHV
jgi:hypothetical protein